jgi:DNA-binding MarR family transcriptional regulator/N-acetylglutamate synthase-like GNAT family acetyltransferase
MSRPQIQPKTAQRVAAVRRFNRFYTQRIGVLRDGWLDSSFSLSEARVLYEIKQRDRATATDIGRDLGLDAGYLSRILRDFEKRGLIRKQVSPDDGRQSFLSMTAAGAKAYAPLETRTRQQVSAMLGRISEPEQTRLVLAMQTIETLIDGAPKAGPAVTLREPRAGDFGTIVARHGVLYAEEYGWTENFEGLCAQIVADFVSNFDPKRERCWIAEVDRQYAGSVMLAKDAAEGVARLRLLLVEPSARGLGIGRKLTEECVAFARSCGYRKITLWTHQVLTAARHIYESCGFKLVSSEKRRSWGQQVVSEHWDLEL